MNSKNSFHLSIHLLVWGGIMLIPLAVAYLSGMQDRHIVGLLPVLLGYTVIFYLNYALLIDRYLFNKKISKFVAANVLLIAAVRIVMLLLHDTVFPMPHVAERMAMLLASDTTIPLPAAERIAMLLTGDSIFPSPRTAERIATLLAGDSILPSPYAAKRLLPLAAGDSILPPDYWAQGRYLPMLPRGMQPTVFSALSQVMVVGTSVAIKVTTRWYETQAKISAMEKEKSAAELQQLKNQLNPHFLFNSLNNIYALIAFNPQHAQLAVHNLSDMLRYLLYEASKERISLQKELEFVRDYCDLIKLRITENVRLTLTLPKDDKGVSIAPLLLIAPVENAFKHGVSPTKPSYIHISIEVDDRHTVTCTVRNSSFPKTYADKSGSGIGLENLRKRLNLIYPNRHRWTAKEQNGEFTAQIRIYRIPPETA